MAQIFINYRRDGGAYTAALLDELLSKHFGETQVFRAAKSIIAGSDYVAAILKAIRGCDAMLVIVDDHWLEKFETGNYISSPDSDWVLREIEEAFKWERIVIPVLLSGVNRLREEDLPVALTKLATLQYLRFDYRNIQQDSIYMAKQLVRVCPGITEERDLHSQRSGWFWSILGRVYRSR
ncbi:MULTISPECIES: toll/interleukin-1 receptor domain-containing protein [Streptomyces]|uniref:toll/interleukin-1 receptor domain-containing protein n=1 Tax=Streptomyces TaxID=1883 RepID=UPI0009405835|nr:MULTISPECIES: toll/interleukin-1 receptor domain-containing protein [unclassified Streptomyces]QNQ36797.1 toll/interleukin-1 receptor domain-containing protein [Streptomyces sp. CB00271]